MSITGLFLIAINKQLPKNPNFKTLEHTLVTNKKDYEIAFTLNSIYYTNIHIYKEGLEDVNSLNNSARWDHEVFFFLNLHNKQILLL